MKYILLLISIMLLLVSVASAEDGARTAFGGVGYFAPSAPDIRAFAGVAIPINEAKTIRSVTDLDIYPRSDGNVSIAGKRLQFEVKSGIAYDVFSLNGFKLFGLGAPGMVTDGDSLGLKFEYGGGVHKMVTPRWGLMTVFTAETYKDFEVDEYKTNFAPRFGVTFAF